MSFGNNIIIPLVPVEANMLGVNVQDIGFIASLFSMSILLMQPFVSTILSAKNKRNVLLFAITLIGSSMFIMFVFDNTTALKISRLIHGLGVAFSVTSCMTLVTEAVDTKDLDRAISLYGFAEVGTGAICPAIGLKLIDLIGFKYTYLICFISLCIAFVLTCLYKYECIETKISFNLKNLIATEGLIPVLSNIVYQIPSSTISTYIILYMNYCGIADASYFFILQSICLTISKPVLNYLFTKIEKTKITIYSYLLYILCFVLIQNGNYISFVFAAIICGFACGMISPLQQIYCIEAVGKDKNAISVTMSYLGTSVGGIIGNNTCGKLYELMGYKKMYSVMPIFVIISLMILLLFKKYKNKNLLNKCA